MRTKSETRQRLQAIAEEIEVWNARKRNAITAYDEKLALLRQEQDALNYSLIELPAH